MHVTHDCVTNFALALASLSRYLTVTQKGVEEFHIKTVIIVYREYYGLVLPEQTCIIA